MQTLRVPWPSYIRPENKSEIICLRGFEILVNESEKITIIIKAKIIVKISLIASVDNGHYYSRKDDTQQLWKIISP